VGFSSSIPQLGWSNHTRSDGPASAVPGAALGGARRRLVGRRDVGWEAAPRLPVSHRNNTNDTVSVTIGHADEGEALLAEPRVVGREPEGAMFRT
jgi:hypothetical protein